MTRKGLASIFAQCANRIRETVSLDTRDGGALDGFVYQRLREYNIHHIFAELYEQHSTDKQLANLKAVYAIMAYSYDSKWIDVEQDRYINKKDILTTLLADAGIDLSKDEFDAIIFNHDEALAYCINSYLENQKDSKFLAVIALTEHIALCNKMAMNTIEVTDNNLNARTKYLGEIETCEKRLQVLKEEIEIKYRNIDEIMTKEGRTPLSRDIDYTIMEQRLKAKKHKNF